MGDDGSPAPPPRAPSPTPFSASSATSALRLSVSFSKDLELPATATLPAHRQLQPAASTLKKKGASSSGGRGSPYADPMVGAGGASARRK